MVADSIENLKKYKVCAPYISQIIKFLSGKQIISLAPGKIKLKGVRLFLMVFDYKTRALNGRRRLESHRNYADIHIVDGEELIYFSEKHSLRRITNYDSKNDVEFYTGKVLNSLILKSKQFALFLPDEPHEPGLNAGSVKLVRKLVFKIKME